jgi:FkbM family methyltransferase
VLRETIKSRLESVGMLALAESSARAARERVTAQGRQARRDRERMVAFYGQFLGAGDLAFDVGAHLGSRVEVFRALGCDVVAVEPQEFCRKRLHRHFGHDLHVTIVPRALDSELGSRVLRGAAASPIASLSTEWISAVTTSGRFDETNFTRESVVKTTTLDSLVAVFGSPRFCKIDVEGYEHVVLGGLSSPIASLSMEFTPEHKASTERCVAKLSSLGRYAYNYVVGEDFALAGPWLEREPFEAHFGAFLGSNPRVFGDVYARFEG